MEGASVQRRSAPQTTSPTPKPTRAKPPRNRCAQQELTFRTWGGKRPGAGRKPKGERAGVSHKPRPEVNGRTPVLITLRVRDDVPRLRRRHLFREIRRALARTKQKEKFRITQFTIQGNHVHILGEPKDKAGLSRGVQGTASLMARRLNRAIGRRGKVFADRYHARYLETPAQVRAAYCYVMNNWRRHDEDRGASHLRVDPFSSADLFDGWSGYRPEQRPPWARTGRTAAGRARADVAEHERVETPRVDRPARGARPRARRAPSPSSDARGALTSAACGGEAPAGARPRAPRSGELVRVPDVAAPVRRRRVCRFEWSASG